MQLPVAEINLRALVFFAWSMTLCLTVGCGSAGREPERNESLVRLGEMLFTDARLSADGNTSCSTCHDPNRLFADGRPVSLGVHKQLGTRNAPSLLGIADVQSFFWDGRGVTLQDVVVQPFTNSVEMGLANPRTVVQHVQGSSEYPLAFVKAFGDGTISINRIGVALTAYLSSQPQGISSYGEYLASGRKFGLTSEQQAGLTLFQGKAACSDCHLLHATPLTLTDHKFHHAGISFEKVAGRVETMISTLDAVKAEGRAIGNAILTDQDIAELGRFAVTRTPSDLGAFRTPSLRNVALTAPYMHDGSVSTLTEAVEREIYYRSLTSRRRTSLTIEDQQQIIAFLNALSERSTLKQ